MQWERRRGKLEPAATSIWGDWAQRPILVLTAMHGELVSGTDASVVVRALGVGGGAAHVIAEQKPRVVISCGFAGGLDASATPDRVVLATAVREELGDPIVAPEALRTAARDALFGLVVEGEIVCATRIAATPDEKRALARPGRLAVDLESWAIARAAQRAGIPWLAVRVVVDPFDVALPAFARVPRASYLGPRCATRWAGPPRFASSSTSPSGLGVRAARSGSRCAGSPACSRRSRRESTRHRRERVHRRRRRARAPRQGRRGPGPAAGRHHRERARRPAARGRAR